MQPWGDCWFRADAERKRRPRLGSETEVHWRLCARGRHLRSNMHMSPRPSAENARVQKGSEIPGLVNACLSGGAGSPFGPILKPCSQARQQEDVDDKNT